MIPLIGAVRFTLRLRMKANATLRHASSGEHAPAPRTPA
jgi:hypothetical protein